MSEPLFAPVAPIVDFPALEARIRAFWREHGVFEATMRQRLSEGAPSFVFYEGPPTANGLPHNGHALTRVMKDVFPRYKTMQGYSVPRKAGWDTHGLPVEIEVEKELRISGKHAIEEYGVEKFVRRCIDSVFRYTNEWTRFSDELGFWADTEQAYVTYHESYVESVWWALSQLFAKDLLYRGHRVVWWWPRGGTALSAAEVGAGYRTVDDPSAYVRLPLASDPDTALLVWTTTPWTLPSNSFAAVRGDVEYAVVRDGDARLIVAAALREGLESAVGRPLPAERALRGAELVGERYQPPFDWYADEPRASALWRVIEAPFVELDAGTGIVHIAPAFGEVDFEALRAEQKSDPQIPLLCAVQPDGGFDPERAPQTYAGRFVKDCDRDLMRELRGRGLLWHASTIQHEYPFAERADRDPLIQYARPAWYIRTTSRVSEALANNAQVRWLPEHIRDGRFGDFLRNNVDWALSRERYWGTPLNIWVNDETGAMHAPASVAEILELNPDAFGHFDEAREREPGLSPHLRVHKPWIDAVTWTVPGEPGVYRRVPEVIDCWFDSGSMPFAQWGWPHRGQEAFEAAFPADFICEAIDQTRGWFNSLLWIATLLFPERELPRPYRTCLVLGHVCDREGRKESKSKGNYTPPEVILERVRLEFAVVEPAGGALPEGVAQIAREDYEGLDLRGDSASVRIYPEGRDGDARTLELRPARLPRRVIALGETERSALGVTPAPHGHETRPTEVRELAPEHKLWVEDPSASAPGADAFRWFFLASNPPWNNTRHSLGAVRAQQRELPLKLRNVYGFFAIYANIDGFDPADPEAAAGRRPARERALLDRWILSELALTTERVREQMDAFRVYEATGFLTEFVDALSNWYLRRSRERFWAAGLEADKLDAHWTLYDCLVRAAQLLAPMLPFAAEDMWQNLVRSPFPDRSERSVHESRYPEPDTEARDEKLSREMGWVRELVSLGLQVRSAEKLRVRQPLAAAEVVPADADVAAALEAHRELICDELNVKALRLAERADEYVQYSVKPNFRALGRKVGKDVPAIKAFLAGADGAALRRELERSGCIEVRVEDRVHALGSDDVEISLTAREGFAAASGASAVVVLRTQLSPELIEEGLFREVLNRVQTLRKELDLEYTGRIQLALDGAPALLDAVRPRQDLLKRETLALELTLGAPPPEGAHVRELHIDGAPLTLGLQLA